jgi:hypothetical protein
MVYFLLALKDILGCRSIDRQGDDLSARDGRKGVRQLPRSVSERAKVSFGESAGFSRDLPFSWFSFIFFRLFILKIRRGNLSRSSEEKPIRCLIPHCSAAWQDPHMLPRKNTRRLWIRSIVIANVMNRLSII